MPQIEDLGISFVHNITARMGYFFKEQSKHDFGIDALVETSIEIPDKPDRGSGRNLALQIKSGESYINKDKAGDIVFYTDRRHIDYWANYSLPVILVLYSSELNQAWWCDIKEYLSRHPKTLEEGPNVIRLAATSTLKVEDKAAWHYIASNPSHPLDLSRKNYTLLEKQDVSFTLKRYKASILVGNYVNREIIRLAIYQVVKHLQSIVEHSSPLQEKKWGDHPPHLIYIFVYFDTDDKHYSTQWTAKAVWRSDPEKFKDEWAIRVNDYVDSIEIEFVDEEKRRAFKEFLSSSESTKTHFIKKVNTWVPMSEDLVSKAKDLFEDLNIGKITQESFEENMIHLARRFDIIMNGYDDGTTAPAECHNAQYAFLDCIHAGHNIFLPFSPSGLKTWPNPANRKMLVKQYLKSYPAERERLRVEMENLRRG